MAYNFRKKAELIIVLVVLITGLGLLITSQDVEASQQQDQDPQLVFPVVSDTQIGRVEGDLGRFEEAMKQLNRLAPNQDAFVFLGDLTSSGTEKQYNAWLSVFNQYIQPQAEQVIGIGNHDYISLSPEAAQQQFVNKTGMPSLYYTKVIKGYSFIMLGEEKGYFYSKEQIRWLQDQLQKAQERDPNKPIFVFLHHALQDTVYGTNTWYIDKENQKLLRQTLSKYPQVILMAGHTHYPISDPRQIYQDQFTSVNSGSIAYMWTEAGYLQGEIPSDRVSNGLLVKVYKDKVVIKRRKFHGNKWVGDPWVIKTPVQKTNFKYTDNRDHKKPHFNKNAELSVLNKETTLTSVKIKFDQAVDNLLTHSYKVTAKNKKTNEIIRQYKAFSEYYKAEMPDPLILPIKGLEHDTAYTIEVQAIDAYGNKSKQTLRTIAKTKSVELVSVSAQPGAISPGGSTAIKATLHNYSNKSSTGILKIEVPKAWETPFIRLPYKLKGQEKKTFNFKVIAPDKFSGKANFTLTLSVDNKKLQSKKLTVYVGMLLGENFEGLTSLLKSSVDEQIDQSILGWTHKAPVGWEVVNAPDMPQGVTEWQGWSFATKEFWTAADKQGRENFDLGEGILAIADSDEWDDKGSPSSSGMFDSTLKSPQIAVQGGETLYLRFATHYKQYANQTALVTASFNNGQIRHWYALINIQVRTMVVEMY